MEEEEDISPEQTEKLIQFQDLTGNDDMAQCKELLKSNNWDLEAAVQHHLVHQVPKCIENWNVCPFMDVPEMHKRPIFFYYLISIQLTITL